MSKYIWLITLLAVSGAAPMAATSADTNTSATGANMGSSKDEQEANKIASEFNVPASEVMDLHSNKKLSWKEIRQALVISEKSGTSLPEVVQLHDQGLSFKDISKRYNLDWSDVKKGKPSEMRDAPAGTTPSQPATSPETGGSMSNPETPQTPGSTGVNPSAPGAPGTPTDQGSTSPGTQP